MKKVKYKIKIGSTEHTVLVEAEEENNETIVFDGEDFIRAQRQLAKQIVYDTQNADDLTPEIFNYLVDITGFTNSEIAKYMTIDPASISQWRRKKGISGVAWQAFRLFFNDLFLNGHITNEIFIANKHYKKAS